jgi:hypothetical protein
MVEPLDGNPGQRPIGRLHERSAQFHGHQAGVLEGRMGEPALGARWDAGKRAGDVRHGQPSAPREHRPRDVTEATAEPRRSRTGQPAQDAGGGARR